MSAIKRFAFVAGFVIGLAGFVASVGSVLLYLLTGKLPAVEMGESGRPTWALMTPREVVAAVKGQMERETAKRLGARSESDELW